MGHEKREGLKTGPRGFQFLTVWVVKEAHKSTEKEKPKRWEGTRRVMLSGCFRKNGNAVFDKHHQESRGNDCKASNKTI